MKDSGFDYINVIPLVDVMLVLLTIVLTTSTFVATGSGFDGVEEIVFTNMTYTVAGWASVNEGTEGPPVWDLVEAHIRAQGTVTVEPNTAVKVTGI